MALPALLPPDPPLMIGAPLPWPTYKAPPKPKVADVLAAAERERELHEPRVQQGYQMLRRYNLDPALRGFFQRDRPGIIDGEVETFPDPALRNEIDAIITFIAGMDRTIEAAYRLSIDKDEAQAKEDGCAYILEQQQRQYSREGGSLLIAAKTFDLLVSGMIAEFRGVDVDNEEIGLRFRLVDPNTVFPIWAGERGLWQVYRKYEVSASRFIGDFGGHPKFKEAMVVKSAGGKSGFDPNFMGEVVEYWDTEHYLITWNSELALTDSHHYHRVPWNITPGNFGQPAHLSAPHLMRYPDGTFWADDRKEDYKRLYQPFLEREIPLHEIKEALVGQLVTAARKAKNPARYLRAGILTFDEPPSKIDNREGALNLLRDDDELEEVPTTPDPTIMQPLWAALTAAEATSRPSALMAGNAPMSQGSGTALDLLARSGKEKWMLPVMVMERHETTGLEMDLANWRDFGDILGMEGDRGAIYVPRSRANPTTGDAAAHEITPTLLRKTGIRVKVIFSRFNPDELPMLTQATTMLKEAALIPDREAIRILGYTTDPDRAVADIRREMMEMTPVMQMLATLRGLMEEMRQAAWREDFESFEQKLAELEFVAGQYEIQQFTQEAQLMQTRMLRQQMQLQQTRMGMGLPGTGGPPGGGGGMNGMTGHLGLPTGTQGGSPMGQRGPQMNPAGMPSMSQIGGGYG